MTRALILALLLAAPRIARADCNDVDLDVTNKMGAKLHVNSVQVIAADPPHTKSSTKASIAIDTDRTGSTRLAFANIANGSFVFGRIWFATWNATQRRWRRSSRPLTGLCQQGEVWRIVIEPRGY